MLTAGLPIGLMVNNHVLLVGGVLVVAPEVILDVLESLLD
jgi:hypothetical protein